MSFGRFDGRARGLLDGLRSRLSEKVKSKESSAAESPTMDIVSIVLFSLFIGGMIVAAYFMWQWMMNGRVSVLSGSHYAKYPQTQSQSLAISQPMAISFWIYINNWDYKRTVVKTVVKKGSVEFSLDANNNTLITSLPAMPMGSTIQINSQSLPLRKWVHVVFIISNDGTNVGDLWINGQIVGSKPLVGLAITTDDENADINISPSGGFDGNISSLLFFPHAITREYVHRLYSEGPISAS
jgi:hypothetical protein